MRIPALTMLALFSRAAARQSSSTAFVASGAPSCVGRHCSTRSPAFGLLTAHHLPTALFSTATEESTTKPPVPVTLLAGFLGSGKTTALKNLLENREGIKVGVIVNDVASVNIDAKLIANPGNDDYSSSEFATDPQTGTAIETEYGGTVELQNGCACCSLADELLTSVQTLMDGREFDAVVVELSGVADPVAVKQNWDMARMVSLKFFNMLICLVLVLLVVGKRLCEMVGYGHYGHGHMHRFFSLFIAGVANRYLLTSVCAI